MNKLQVIEHKEQRILTTQQLAEAYGAEAKHINDNFANNKTRYELGKHYFVLEGEELKEFKEAYPNILGNLKYAPILYLWTEKGAWLHAKSLGTDRAWEAYEMLVDDYFQKRDLAKLIASDPILAVRVQQIEMEQRLTQVEEKASTVEIKAAVAEEQATLAHKRINALDAVDPIGEPRQQLVALVNKYAQRNGIQYNQAWLDFRTAFNIAFRTNVMLKMKHYARKNNRKKMTVPEYLEITNQIQDALRVADKILNPARRLTAL